MLQPPLKEFYRFNPMRNREGEISRYHREFVDHKDFNLHPRLMQQLQLDTCHETTPEGKALWLYFRLCQLLKYDEGYFYQEYRRHPNDDMCASFDIVGDVTAETPVTCFNFSRIAVKLLNQIKGVHALMIAVGDNDGHLRFGYYTDKVSVDADPAAPQNHYSDMARIKLGIAPQGLKVFNGQPLMEQLMERIAPQMLAPTQRSLRQYLDIIQSMSLVPNTTQIDIRHLTKELKAQGVDGTSMIQLLFGMNRNFVQPPYRFARAAWLDSPNDYDRLQPQLLVRENKKISQIDLRTLDVLQLPVAVYREFVRTGALIFPFDDYQDTIVVGRNFDYGLEC